MNHEADREALVEVIEAALTGALAAIRRLKRDAAQSSRGRGRSQTDIAIQILTDAPEELHIDAIIRLAADTYNRKLQRDSLSSALAKKIRDGAAVSKVGRNVFEVKKPDTGGQ